MVPGFDAAVTLSRCGRDFFLVQIRKILLRILGHPIQLCFRCVRQNFDEFCLIKYANIIFRSPHCNFVPLP